MGLFSQLATRPVYNTRAVVLRTGVPADTFRAWERRYGLPSPARTDGNQRLYSDRDIAMIGWLRDQTRSGLTISHAVELFRTRGSVPVPSDRAEPSASSDAVAISRPKIEDATLPRYARQLVGALCAYDSRAASQILDEVLSLVTAEDVCLQVLQPALYEIGARWQRGELLISGEHFATAFAVRKLGSLFNLSRPDYGRGPIVAACLQGELHEVGLLMTCLFLSRRGFQVTYLGPDLPREDLVATIQEIRPLLVLLSASTPEGAGNLSRSSRAILDACSEFGDGACVPEIGFGGRVYLEMPFLQHGVAGIFCGRDANEAVETIESVVGRVTAG